MNGRHSPSNAPPVLERTRTMAYDFDEHTEIAEAEEEPTLQGKLILDPEPVRPEPAPPAVQPRRGPRRPRWALIVLAAAGMGLGVLAAIVLN